MTRHIHPRSTSRDIAQHVREAEGQHDWSSGPWRYPPQPEPRRAPPGAAWLPALIVGAVIWGCIGLIAALIF